MLQKSKYHKWEIRVKYSNFPFAFGYALLLGAYDRKIAEALTGFLFKTNFGRSFHHILEMPLFVSSAVTPAVQFADIFAGIVRHYYENELDQKEPETDFQKWIVELFNKLYKLTENNYIPKSHYVEYGFQKIGKNFSYPVSDKLSDSEE